MFTLDHSKPHELRRTIINMIEKVLVDFIQPMVGIAIKHCITCAVFSNYTNPYECFDIFTSIKVRTI
jgi:hypothetical protein